jgi:hypothetical protein
MKSHMKINLENMMYQPLPAIYGYMICSQVNTVN